MTLRVGVDAMPFTPAGVDLVRQAERLGVDSVWVPEFWAADALTPLGYLAGQTSTIRLATGIAQLGARPRRCSPCPPKHCRRCPAAGSCSASAPAVRR
jgi:alkanesulfonate monooxygenase SsuD/methylene tetrahydromethanopterin reductase-like flavin-dependent oxidoreductase (luciferase family)